MRNLSSFTGSFMREWYWYLLAAIGLYKIFEWYKAKEFKKKKLLILLILIISATLAFFSTLRESNKFEMQRRTKILTSLRIKYILSHNGISPELAAGIKGPPKEWINKELKELGEDWNYEP